MPPTDWLSRISDLNYYCSKHGRAPHKALLLLVVLELAELAFRFNSFWHVVAHRSTQAPDVRMPFHHLRGDGFWK